MFESIAVEGRRSPFDFAHGKKVEGRRSKDV